MRQKKRLYLIVTMLICMLFTAACGTTSPSDTTAVGSEANSMASIPDSIPAYDGSPYVAVNNNKPYFTDKDLTTEAFEQYSELDSLGRCGVAYANICQELMPATERESISQVKPTGWQSVKYDNVDGKYLYNRCHLIGYQLAGENANKQNLITGTRYLNIDGMLPFENMVADYVKETGHHVLYRVTPAFEDENLVATGVLIEALSVEDNGEDICFNVFCYNAQPGVAIDYTTGDSQLGDAVSTSNAAGQEYILNTKTHKFHYSSCSSASGTNMETYTGNRKDLIAQGYDPCGRCKP